MDASTKFEQLKADSEMPGMIFEWICDGLTLGEIGKKKFGLRHSGRFVEWFSTAHAQLYDAALKVRADELAHGALADAAKATRETVNAARLRVETKLRVAGKWDRARYGEHVKVERVERFEVDERLVGLASALLGATQERVVHSEATVLPEQAGGVSPPTSAPVVPVPASLPDGDAAPK